MNNYCYRFIGRAAVVLVACGIASQGSAETIAFIGTGNVSATLGPKFSQMGHDVIYGSRTPLRSDVQQLVAETSNGAFATTPSESVVDADIVVVAVPGGLLTQVVNGLGDLSGKIIVDPTNPLYPDPDDGFANNLFPISNAEMVQNMLPDSFVVKAFNTLGVETMDDPDSAGGPVTIPIAGNDEDAKETVAELIEDLGMQAYDVGPVRYAYVLEGMLALWANGRQMGRPFDYHLQLH